MSGEDQERFEDYLELENYISQLQAGQIAHPPAHLSPEQVRIYQTANFFRSALPGAAEPDPEFAAQLHTRLEQELETMQAEMQMETQKRSAATVTPRETAPARRKNAFSRRNLLAGGAAAAATFVLGAGVEHLREQTGSSAPGSVSQTSDVKLVPAEIEATWHEVGSLARVKKDAVPFNAGSIVGYALFNEPDPGEKDNPDAGKVIAVSAACTHMGCIVNWESAHRQFRCPCHGGLFTEYGKVDNYAKGISYYLKPLPRLDTKVENGMVYVRVPLKQV